MEGTGTVIVEEIIPWVIWWVHVRLLLLLRGNLKSIATVLKVWWRLLLHILLLLILLNSHFIWIHLFTFPSPFSHIIGLDWFLGCDLVSRIRRNSIHSLSHYRPSGCAWTVVWRLITPICTLRDAITNVVASDTISGTTSKLPNATTWRKEFTKMSILFVLISNKLSWLCLLLGVRQLAQKCRTESFFIMASARNKKCKQIYIFQTKSEKIKKWVWLCKVRKSRF